MEHNLQPSLPLQPSAADRSGRSGEQLFEVSLYPDQVRTLRFVGGKLKAAGIGDGDEISRAVQLVVDQIGEFR